MKTLNELFNRPVPYKQTRKGVYTFEIDDVPYMVTFIRSTSVGTMKTKVAIIFSATVDGWTLSGKTGTGNEFQVFATIVQILKEYEKKYHPDFYYFSAKEPSRQKLYLKMIKRFAKKFEYTTLVDNGEMMFELKRIT